MTIRYKQVATRRIEICWETGLERQFISRQLDCINLLNEIGLKRQSVKSSNENINKTKEVHK